ncbi:MAG: cell division protein ZipA C-terminal FtsZ-binding domain-containing protein [Gammaproteobacteria bacterium]|nr:cell division protein ZipA C-terminal FtsZ-binding domain-containing protein [Gammaproteobacteria bacterium]
MNLSLIIMVVMIAAVIPWLTMRFLKAQPKKPPALFEQKFHDVLKKPIKDPYAILDCLSSDLEPKEILGIKKYAIAVVAEADQEFKGFDILQAMTSAGLAYGQGKLFHYHIAKEIIFSVAPQAEPYHFDLDSIAEFKTRGLHFIFDATKTGYEDLAKEVALQLAEELQGEVRETLR